jgi:leucyl aminopeptidase
MEFLQYYSLSKRHHADALVIPFWKGDKGAEAATSIDKALKRVIASPLSSGDFQGKEGETLFIYVDEDFEKRLILLGLGAQEKVSVEVIRRAYGSLTKTALLKKLSDLNVILPECQALVEKDLFRGVSEGLLLPNYLYKKFKHQQPDEESGQILVQKVALIGEDPSALEAAQKAAAILDGVYYARDLVNGNADEITPQYLVQCANGLSLEQPSLKVTTLNKKEIEKAKLGLLLAVNRGSALDPALIIIEYKGNPRSDDRTVVVGKGVTYDTGGLNLKPTGSMETMKCDMAGAAACIGTLLAVSHLKLKVNVIAVIPSTENGIDAKSFKPGDIYTSFLGKTVEVMNTDAEGRLILADGLAYAIKKLNPSRILDIATLTGAIDIALGAEASGLMSTDDDLAQALIQAGAATAERLWRMPLFEEYSERLKSDIADLKNWNGRPGAANVAAAFLKEFVDSTIPWAHLDIASTAYLSEPKKYLPKYATGVGVRLLIEFFEQLEKRPPTKKDRKQDRQKRQG